MAIRDLIARGIGFTPASVKFIPTHGLSIASTAVARRGREESIAPGPARQTSIGPAPAAEQSVSGMPVKGSTAD